MNLTAELTRHLPNAVSEEDRKEIEDVLDAATALALGDIPIQVFAHIGTMLSPVSRKPSSGYTRHAAFVTTPKTDGRRAALGRAIDKLLVFQGLRLTNHGLFSHDDLAGTGVTVKQGEPPVW